MRVRDVMTSDVVTVEPGLPVRELASLLAERHLSGVPVVDGDGRLVGVVSETDIVRKEAAGPRRRHGGILRWLDPESGQISAKLDARTAGDAMTAPAVTIEVDRSVNAAASLMLERACKRLPVTDGGRLVGIVSRSDLVRAFVRSDADIVREVRESVALGTFAIPPETLHVESANGDVTLGGEVETDETARLLAEFVGRVPGVVSVRSHLTSRSGGPSGHRDY